MSYCKVVSFSELRAGWLPRDHILEAQLDEVLEKLAKKQDRLAKMTAEVMEIQEKIRSLTTRISSKEYRPSKRVA